MQRQISRSLRVGDQAATAYGAAIKLGAGRGEVRSAASEHDVAGKARSAHITAERYGQAYVLAVSGELDQGSAARLAEITERVTASAMRPGRIVIDLSGVSSLDHDAVKVLAKAARPGPGRCPVAIRSLRPVLRRALQVTDADLDLIAPELAAMGLPLSPAASRSEAADSPIESLLQDSQELRVKSAQILSRSRQLLAENRRIVAAVGETEAKAAAALLRLAVHRPPVSGQLAAMSQSARNQAMQMREHAAALRTAARPPSGRHCLDTLCRALAFIEDRACDDITVTDIAAASFVTVRTVQLSFRQHLGTTPLTYLRQVRLERAHQELLAADPRRATVAQIASRWKFSNSSRFAVYYRAIYNVMPSETLHSGPATDRHIQLALVAGGQA